MSDEFSAPRAQNATTAWRRIADELAAAFARGDFSDGAALPPAQDLARTHGVHRHTVRQAYIHLQEQGFITIRRGAGAFYTGLRLPYRIGRRVRLRDNLRAHNVTVVGRIVNSTRVTSTAVLALELAIKPGAPVWRIDILNSTKDLALSLSRHHACATAFPDLPMRLAAGGGSFTAAFLSYGLEDYERRSTHITARLPSLDEASALGILPSEPVLATHALDVTSAGEPLQAVDAAFRGDRIELRVETD